jgi:hypothetical protein
MSLTFLIHEQVKFIGNTNVAYFKASASNRQIPDRAVDNTVPVKQDPCRNGCGNANVASALEHLLGLSPFCFLPVIALNPLERSLRR